jgi:hypothetical protein
VQQQYCTPLQQLHRRLPLLALCGCSCCLPDLPACRHTRSAHGVARRPFPLKVALGGDASAGSHTNSTPEQIQWWVGCAGWHCCSSCGSLVGFLLAAAQWWHSCHQETSRDCARVLCQKRLAAAVKRCVCRHTSASCTYWCVQAMHHSAAAAAHTTISPPMQPCLGLQVIMLVEPEQQLRHLMHLRRLQCMAGAAAHQPSAHQCISAPPHPTPPHPPGLLPCPGCR